ncbi:hypothetical protein [Budvicia aquatica]|uniref:hypothetical protein n=1 Tax=Budvicia aquatica TaxID=82979 RepID=UPI0020820C92|nr:hypothetical protein [Budvicia aquatica]GKX53511.1 hypothetical protein SOASR029_38200 [Budvicia aquatica]
MTQYTPGTPRTPLAVLIAVILIGFVVPVGAVLSDPTGIIHGRAPTATGDLYALMPDGTTVVTNNVIVSQTATPNQFTPSMVTTGITPFDADGDIGLTLDMPSATLVWKHNGTALTATHLAAPLVTNFPNSTVTLEVHAPVTTMSTTGLPTTAGPVTFVTTYAVKVPLAPIPMPATVKLASQYTTWAASSGFPKTAFPGASYTLWMNGSTTLTNTQYTYESTQPWVTVTAGGVVSFVSMPPSASKTAKIFATRKDNGVVYTLNVAPIKWYASGKSVNDTSIPNYTEALADCKTKGGTIPKVSELGSNSVSRVTGKMVDEWGGVLGQRSYTRLGSPIWHMLSDSYQNTSERKIPVAIHDGSAAASKVGYYETGVFNAKGIFALCSIPII